MSKCPGLHCDGCGNGGSGPLGGIIAGLVLLGIAAAERKAIDHGVDVLVRVLVITLVTAGSIVLLAVITWAAVAVRRHQLRQRAGQPRYLPPARAPGRARPLTGRVLPPAALPPASGRPEPSWLPRTGGKAQPGRNS